MIDLILLTIGFGAGILALGFTLVFILMLRVIFLSKKRKLFTNMFLLSFFSVTIFLWLVAYFLV